MSNLNELKYVTIWKLKTREGATETESRDWLPVTHIDKIHGRITVKAPYPIGDYDVVTTESKACETCEGLGYLQKVECPTCHDTHLMECPVCHGRQTAGCDTQELCAYCGGSGKVPCETCYSGAKEFWVPADHCTGDGCIPCPDCNGTGYAGGGGVISVTPEGVITLRYDSVTLGITDDGKLFARLKIKTNGGLDINDDNEIFVKVDETTIRINDNGELESVYKPFSASAAGQHDVTSGHEGTQSFTTGVVITDETINRVHAFLTLDIYYPDYETAHELTNLIVSMQIGDGAFEQVGTATWDLTVPYTMLNFDKVMERFVHDSPIVIKLEGEHGDHIYHNTSIKWTLNVVSC